MTEDLYHFINEAEYEANLMDEGFSREEAEVLANRRTRELAKQVELGLIKKLQQERSAL